MPIGSINQILSSEMCLFTHIYCQKGQFHTVTATMQSFCILAIHMGIKRPVTNNKSLWMFGLLMGSLLGIQPAQAAGMNCDVRQLSLSQAQQNQLRLLRNQYRILRDEQTRKKPSATASRRYLVQILMQDDFNENAARQYVSQKYQYNAELDMQDLRMQHYFFKVLTPQQKQQWIRYCQQ